MSCFPSFFVLMNLCSMFITIYIHWMLVSHWRVGRIMHAMWIKWLVWEENIWCLQVRRCMKRFERATARYIFEVLDIPSEVRPNFLVLCHFHSNKIRNFFDSCLALHTLVEGGSIPIIEADMLTFLMTSFMFNWFIGHRSRLTSWIRGSLRMMNKS